MRQGQGSYRKTLGILGLNAALVLATGCGREGAPNESAVQVFIAGARANNLGIASYEVTAAGDTTSIRLHGKGDANLGELKIVKTNYTKTEDDGSIWTPTRIVTFVQKGSLRAKVEATAPTTVMLSDQAKAQDSQLSNVAMLDPALSATFADLQLEFAQKPMKSEETPYSGEMCCPGPLYCYGVNQFWGIYWGCADFGITNGLDYQETRWDCDCVPGAEGYIHEVFRHCGPAGPPNGNCQVDSIVDDWC